MTHQIESVWDILNGSSEGVDVSSSELKTFAQCPIKWFWKYGVELRAKRVGKAASFGLLIHHTLEKFYSPSKDSNDRTKNFLFHCLEKAYREELIEGFVDPEKKQWKTAYTILNNYFDHWKSKSYDPIGVEPNFRTAVFNSNGLTGFIHGRWDLITRRDDKIWVVDHKTTSRFSWKTVDVDSQFDLYYLAGFKMFGKEFGGVEVNAIRSKISPSRANFLRIPIIKNLKEVDFIERSLARRLNQLTHLEPEDLFFNFQKSCAWKCDFLGLCRLIRQGSSTREYLDDNFCIRDRSEEQQKEMKDG